MAPGGPSVLRFLTAVLTGGLVASGATLAISEVLLLVAPRPGPDWYLAGLLAHLVVMLGSTGAGGFLASRLTGTVGPAVTLGLLLLGLFLLRVRLHLEVVWHTAAAAALLVPAAGLGGFLGAAGAARARGTAGPVVGTTGRVSGWIVGLIALHLLIDRLRIGFTALDVGVLVALAGLSRALLHPFARARSSRLLQMALLVVSTLTIPFGCFALRNSPDARAIRRRAGCTRTLAGDAALASPSPTWTGSTSRHRWPASRA